MSNKALENHYLKPFLKWAGGKRWFIHEHSELLPQKYNRYIEPFLGSGAVFFYLEPEKALLGDINPDLIETYEAIRDDWRLVVRHLRQHQREHSEYHYYKVRSFVPEKLHAKAARFIYLNRTCWNGLYRVNRMGLFNVPIGDRSTVIFPDDCFDRISEALQVAQLYKSDFEVLINKAKKDDLLFVDPPYTVSHNHNAFIKYNEKLFSWSDQERLFESLKRAKRRGVKIVATNAFHHSVQEMYGDSFETIQVSRQSTIASDSASRKKFEELVILTER